MTSKLVFGGLLLLCFVAMARAEQAVHRAHAIAMYDEPKYPADFMHFDYVNPQAPKGGTLRLGAEGTFDSFHPYIPKGNAVSTGAIETLLISSLDEPFTVYGLLAETLEWPEDRSWVIFNLRPEARWHDGRPVTADDVVWSFETLTAKGLPQYRFYYGSVEKVEKLGERRVRFNFKERNNRELPLIVGQLPVLPKHYWAEHDFEKTTLEPPLGSGPYRITDFEAGRYAVQERVADYWGRELPANRGLNNFDNIRSVYYRDATAIRLALKSGDIDLRQENQAKAWALDYDVPAVRKGWLIKAQIPHQMPTGMQGFVMNTRRGLFSDPKVREALAYAFDFEWTNRNLFFGQYTRTDSYFSNSELAAEGLPEGDELALLEPFRNRVPAQVFSESYQPPATDGSGWPRDNLRTATRLLAEAGWVVRNMKLVNGKTGEPFRFEILLVSQAFERIVLPFTRNLNRLGIDARVRLVDQTQYVNRLRSFDFDMLISVWGQSENPGNEQRNYWTTPSADQAGSRNYAGIKDPVVDELVEQLVASPNRASLVTRTRALDRVLLWGHYVIPNWHIAADRMLYWDKFSRPELPVKTGAFTSRWWFDEAKAAQLEAAVEANRELVEPAAEEAGVDAPWKWLLLAALLTLGGWSVRRYWREKP